MRVAVHAGSCGFFEGAEEGLEVLGFAEVAVDAGEADVGDGVHFFQCFHDEFAELGGGDVGFAGGFELADDAGDDALDPFVLDGALAEGDADGAGELIAVEGDAAAVVLDHCEVAELDALDRGEALATAAAEAAAALPTVQWPSSSRHAVPRLV